MRSEPNPTLADDSTELESILPAQIKSSLERINEARATALQLGIDLPRELGQVVIKPRLSITGGEVLTMSLDDIRGRAGFWLHAKTTFGSLRVSPGEIQDLIAKNGATRIEAAIVEVLDRATQRLKSSGRFDEPETDAFVVNLPRITKVIKAEAFDVEARLDQLYDRIVGPDGTPLRGLGWASADALLHEADIERSLRGRVGTSESIGLRCRRHPSIALVSDVQGETEEELYDSRDAFEVLIARNEAFAAAFDDLCGAVEAWARRRGLWQGP